MRTRFALVVGLLVCDFGVASAQVQEDWVARYHGPANFEDLARAIAVDTAGNVYVTGGVCSRVEFPEDAYPFCGDSDYATIKYDVRGAELWVARYNGPANSYDEAYAIAVDAAGNVYVTGRSGYDYYALIKYDAAGNELWVSRYDRAPYAEDVAAAIALDPAANVYVTGSSSGVGTWTDYATIKYDTNGNRLWVARYNGPGNSSDEARAIAVDPAGNVYVTGWSWGGAGSQEDYATVKYDSGGNERWVARYDGAANAVDVASAIALDSTGNVYVTGWSDGVTSSDYATIKYDADGNQIWVARYNGPGNSADGARAVALDAADGVFVTGLSLTGFLSSTADYATIKYSTDGTQLWVARYNGPGNGNDEASAIAVDATGNVYVTGQSAGANYASYDYATIKYDTDGSELWLARYNNGSDQASAIALDPADNVYVTGSSWDYATIKYSQTPVPSVTLSETTGVRGGTAGGTVVATVTNGPGNTGDWVGLYTTSGTAVQWQYLDGTQVKPPLGAAEK